MAKIDLSDKNQLAQYLKQKGLWAKKSLSQNFLVDKNALDKIVNAGEIKPDETIIEIGPGVGTLTQELVSRSDRVIAIELDQQLANLLEGISGLRVINNDITKVNLNELIGDQKYKVIANIPYHITSRVLELFLTMENKPLLMVLLVQKEVAERVCAEPGEMSVLSVSVQLYGKPEIIDFVPAKFFFPEPKVDSAILKIATSRKPSAISNEREFFRLVHIGFASRRKTLVNNLSAGYHISKEKAFDIIRRAELGHNVRAQELSLENWAKLLKLIEF